MEINEKDFRKIGQDGCVYVKAVRMDVFKMTQDAFAGLLGVGPSTLRNWESGVSKPPDYVLRAVKIMASNPGQALAELETGICVDPDDRPGWESGRMAAKLRHEDAVDWMKRDPTRVKAMDLMDNLAEFASRCRDLGYPQPSMTDLLLMSVSMQLDELADRLGSKNY